MIFATYEQNTTERSSRETQKAAKDFLTPILANNQWEKFECTILTSPAKFIALKLHNLCLL